MMAPPRRTAVGPFARRNTAGFVLSALGTIVNPSLLPESDRRRLPPTPETHVAVVTDGHQGFGLAIVRALAERGMRVVMTSREPERAREALDKLGDLADHVAVKQLDVSDTDSVARLTSWLEHRLGRCDSLLNNVAILGDDEHTSVDIDLDVVRQTLEVNLLGTWRLAQAVAPLMSRRGYGRIVNISRELATAHAPGAGLHAYRVSQTAIIELTRMLADDLVDEGILVNACCPVAAAIPSGDDADSRLLIPSPDTAVWLATLADDGPTGGLFRGG